MSKPESNTERKPEKPNEGSSFTDETRERILNPGDKTGKGSDADSNQEASLKNQNRAEARVKTSIEGLAAENQTTADSIAAKIAGGEIPVGKSQIIYRGQEGSVNGKIGRPPQEIKGETIAVPDLPGQIGDNRFAQRQTGDSLSKSFLRGIEKPNGGEVIPGRDNPQATVKAYEAYLKNLGFKDSARRAADLGNFLQQAEDNFHKPEVSKNLKGTPEQEIARVCKAMNEVMEGKAGPLTKIDRANMVMGMAARIGDPEHYGNQGKHMTCVLESLGNAKMSTQGADHMEALASLANTGKAFVGEGKYRRQISVNEASRTPDGESQQVWNSSAFKKGGKRDLPGQYTDALFGQLSADLKTERLQKSGKFSADMHLDYYAAHVDTAKAGYQPKQNSTYEGLVLSSKAGNKFITEGPGIGMWDAADLHTHVTGHKGGFFVNETFARLSGPKPDGMDADVTVTTFNGSNLKEKLADYQNRTGQAAQIGVNAPYLKGGGENGHGLHAMTASIVDGKVQLDNQWTEGADILAHEMNADEIDKATNPGRWRNADRVDWSKEHFDPESNNDARKNIEEEGEKKRKEKEDEEAKQREAQDKEKQEALAAYDIALKAWQERHDRHLTEQRQRELAARERGEENSFTAEPFTESEPIKPQ